MVSYKQITKGDHPLARKSGVILEHRKNLFDKIGWGPHKCHWCKTKIQWRIGDTRYKGNSQRGILYVDHLDGDKRNNHQVNLVPSCVSCNLLRGRGVTPIKQEEIFITRKDGRKHRAEKRYCKNCNVLFHHLKAEKRVNKGKFCSNTCKMKFVRSTRSGQSDISH